MRDREQLIPHEVLELRALWGERQLELGARAREVLGELHSRAREHRRGALDAFQHGLIEITR